MGAAAEWPDRGAFWLSNVTLVLKSRIYMELFGRLGESWGSSQSYTLSLRQHQHDRNNAHLQTTATSTICRAAGEPL